MTDTFTRLTMFTTGEVDQQVYKRTDDPQYLSSAQSLLNMEIATTGLAKKRKGTIRAANVTDCAQQNSHIYDFVDNFGNHYILISADGEFCVYGAPTDSAQVIDHLNNDVITIDGDNVVAFSNTTSLIQHIVTPYDTGDLNSIDYTLDNDSLILTHPDFPPARIYIDSYSGTGVPHFAYAVLNIYPLPSYDFNTINYNGFTVTLSVSGQTLTFRFINVGANPGFTSAWIGGQIIGGGASDIDPVGYAIITNVVYSSGGGGTVTFTATVQIPFQTSGYATQGSQYSVRQPAWSAALGYPAKSLFFQNRLWLANTRSLSNGIFGSKINQPINYDVGTGRDTDAIVYIVGQNASGAIQWMNGGKQMEIYCQNLEFVCPQDQNTALTPSTFALRQQSSYGASANLKPITYINDSYYSTRTGKALINFHFNGVGLSYQASNISIPSSHLVKNPINRALLRGSDTAQDNFVYFLNPDNTITTFQFALEFKLAALTPMVFQEDVHIIDIATIDNTVYMLKFYDKTDQYMLEKIDDSTRVDGQFEAFMNTDGSVTGLAALNGYTVQVLYLNQDFGEYEVVGGEIVVNNPDEIADTVIIGLLYENNLIPMYPFTAVNESPFKKQVNRIYVDYYNSLDFYVNGNLVPFMEFPLYNNKPVTPKTDTAIIDPFTGWNRFDQDGVPIISITQRSPYDLQILGIGYQVSSALI